MTEKPEGSDRRTWGRRARSIPSPSTRFMRVTLVLSLGEYGCGRQISRKLAK